ncbi:sugar transferase [Pseudosporangium ferrugineum]|uniref:Lipopolysaccharide/colanic/teichoic acid biosynthesis glycosyltransferase n=1 Tax=Pseudosporangium ferrugineum TaxID=439699 RepID=A0A2T0RDM6_9ACTN|nr:sugar transferase [Pseudosporangium ferrugineum]PRY19268.1 lipopolysaccharide/colanic/teichoic acid biosynthesis glycosyltransferase [Pseudosporangium ferrugineum]
MIDRVRLHDRIQRSTDILVALVMLTLTAPLMLAVAALVAWRLGTPVLFRQARPGLHGRVFTMIKFRTMRDVDPDRGLITDADRMTRLGRILRATSVDELPTFLNILKGDMSLVGPRPLLVRYLHLYTPTQARRHEVRPGLTGLAQVRGRNALSWEDKFDLDVWYVDHRTLRLNLRILVETVTTVLRREGIAAEGQVTMPEFTGSRGRARGVARV